jgi:hypothetical protein
MRIDRGSSKRLGKYPLRPDVMERVCRKLASDMRAEEAAGWGPVPMTGNGGVGIAGLLRFGLPRSEAAQSLDRAAERWRQEIENGICNVESRVRLGEPVW